GEWDLAVFWLRHLMLNLGRSDAQHGTSLLLSPHNSWTLPALTREQAATHLAPWLEAYQRACNGPLPFFSRASFGYAQRLAKPSTRSSKTPLQAARDEARNSWYGNDHVGGESEDPYNALVFRDRD